ncbi:glycosyltransferase family 2 protein [Chroococcus sp. FPU101]|uniref:glycosyltransferase n=1 Tax=Chroococcus sp. FPU101 TaxID=1974212 RepID=UPI001A8F6C05|nr:glycosyltransferase [Chroococcus sp. FPU101]GFE67661.1 glycosyl transferase family 2 [Chroococcus sp. FPU101]
MNQNLLFSIIIPTYNRPERLKTCLESLVNLNFPLEQLEVVIVDDGSNQPLDELIDNFNKQLSIQLIRQNNAGPATARNTGANQAKGKYLVFTDDDCQVDSNWLQAFDKGFKQNPDALLGGYTINALSDNLYSEASQLLVDYLYHYYNNNSEQASFFTSNNFALSKELFEQIGGFNTSFPLAAGEDRELCDRWLSYDYPMHYLPTAIIYHSHQLSLKKFWKQHFNYGCGAFYFHQVRSQRKQESIKVEPLSFYFKLLTYPFSSSSNQSKLFLSLLFFVSQLANVYGFFRTRFLYKSSFNDNLNYLQVNDKKQAT